MNPNQPNPLQPNFNGNGAGPESQQQSQPQPIQPTVIQPASQQAAEQQSGVVPGQPAPTPLNPVVPAQNPNYSQASTPGQSVNNLQQGYPAYPQNTGVPQAQNIPTYNSAPTQQPANSDYYANGAKPGNTLGILSLVLALLIAPIGIILGIISIIKGFGKGNKTLGILGVGGVVLGLIVSVASFFLYFTFFSSTSIGDLKAQEVQVAGINVSLSVPEKLEKQPDNPDGSVSFALKIKDDKGNEGAVAQIGISSLAGNTPETLEFIKTSLKDMQSEDARYLLASAKETYRYTIETNVCENVQIGNFEKLNTPNVEFALKATFTCKASDDAEYFGTILDIGTKTNETAVIVAADKSLWDLNADKFEEVLSSVTVKE